MDRSLGKMLSMLAASGFAILLMTMIGCGGGGSTSGVASAPASQGTTISGVVAKGLFSAGTVDCYLISGATEKLQTTTSIGADGSYSLRLGSYTGIVVLKASGRYRDEATNTDVGISVPLRAALVIDAANSGGTVIASITPLTELAVSYALDKSIDQTFTEQNIRLANARLSDIFPFDILATKPVAPDALALNSASDAQKCYTLTLAGISQSAAAPSATLASVLASCRSDLKQFGRLTESSVTALKSSTQAFLDRGTPYNRTGYTSTTQIPTFQSVGTYTTVVTILTEKNSGSADSNANLIQFSLVLDANFLVDNIDGKPTDGVITLTTTDPKTTLASFVSTVSSSPVLNVAVTAENGLGIGQVATIRLKTMPGFIPVPGSISVRHLYQNGQEIMLIPFASKNDTNTSPVDWRISAVY